MQATSEMADSSLWGSGYLAVSAIGKKNSGCDCRTKRKICSKEHGQKGINQ